MFPEVTRKPRENHPRATAADYTKSVTILGLAYFPEDNIDQHLDKSHSVLASSIVNYLSVFIR